jgi:negative regulator of flagellin synthesis FlgM
MNIQNDLQGLEQVLGAAGLSGTGKEPATPADAGAPTASDQAHLSTAAYLVSQAVALPEVRTDKVASVQAALANGSYQVSSSDLAGKMIGQMLAEK